MNKHLFTIIFCIFLIQSCSQKEDDRANAFSDESFAKSVKKEQKFQMPDPFSKNAQTNRWYSLEQVAEGEKSFKQVCASCHKKDASGTKNWQESVNGVFPPPPLNGDAHAWHHPLTQLHDTIKNGTASVGGNMPAWGRILDDKKILNTIAFFQSKWSDEIYQTWLERNK